MKFERQTPEPKTWMEYRIQTDPPEAAWELPVPTWYDNEDEWLQAIAKVSREMPTLRLRVLRSEWTVHTEEAFLEVGP